MKALFKFSIAIVAMLVCFSAAKAQMAVSVTAQPAKADPSTLVLKVSPYSADMVGYVQALTGADQRELFTSVIADDAKQTITVKVNPKVGMDNESLQNYLASFLDYKVRTANENRSTH